MSSETIAASLLDSLGPHVGGPVVARLVASLVPLSRVELVRALYYMSPLEQSALELSDEEVMARAAAAVVLEGVVAIRQMAGRPVHPDDIECWNDCQRRVDQLLTVAGVRGRRGGGGSRVAVAA